MELRNKSKGICLIHRYLKLNLVSYVQRWVVDFAELDPAKELLDEEVNQELKQQTRYHFLKDIASFHN